MKTGAQQEPRLQEKQEQFKKLGIADKLNEVKSLEKENNVKHQVEHQFEQVERWLEDYSNVFDLVFLDDTEIKSLPNAELLRKVRGIFEGLKNSLDATAKQSDALLEKSRSRYGDIAKKWTAASEQIRSKLDGAIAQLPEHEGKTGRQISAAYPVSYTHLTLPTNREV